VFKNEGERVCYGKEKQSSADVEVGDEPRPSDWTLLK
jgi:hypothetical protein